MTYRNFRLAVAGRVLLLIITISLSFYLLIVQEHLLSFIILCIFVTLQVFDLIRYVEKTNKMLTQLFDSIRHSDFSTSFSNKGLGKSFEELAHAFNSVIFEFKKHRSEKEEQFNYLQTVGQHINVGIICYNLHGKVDMYNNAAKKILRLPNLRDIRELNTVKTDLPQILMAMKSGDKSLVRLVVEDEIRQIAISATEFKMREQDFILVSMQDIHAELEEKEIESWQRLIRVLTHEIMNSITPISSLVSTVHDLIIDESDEMPSLRKLDQEEVESVDNALKTIRNRSNGLLSFVDIYRNLTRIPKPNFRYFEVREVFTRAQQLLKTKLEESNIRCRCDLEPENIMLTADPDLVDQVIINLVLNAIDAVKEKEFPEIIMKAYINKNNRVSIEIKDNGPGIKHDIIDKIFMPFFTSKKTGSGIGLSLSRQIMHLHKGSVSVKSKPGDGSVFILTF
ncbi:MAG: hypothetical protein JXA03_12050 [Bacteroidales bacterium]|nr:hypothetical protein [Bacteroidales bacterium]